MFFSPRISTRQLATIARRLATSLGAGVDARTVFTREAERARGHFARDRFRTIRDAIHRGHSISDAFEQTGDYFPTLFREMLRVGEQSGRLSETLAQLAEHYEGQVRLSRSFLVMLVWPMIELGIALMAIGAVIWICGAILNNLDILGWGLVGNRGLVIYLMILAGIGFAISMLVRAIKRGVFWAGPVQKLALMVPGVGKALQTLCLARLAWAMHLTFNTGMDVLRAVHLSLRSTNNARYTDQSKAIERAIERGDSVAEAFADSGVFPVDFLDALHVAEESGQVSEAMGRLSNSYRQQAEAAMTVLATFGGFALIGLIAIFLIGMIFKMASFYTSTIMDLAKP
jgi:type IV pilus assembly protein PilC